MASIFPVRVMSLVILLLPAAAVAFYFPVSEHGTH